MSGLLVILGRLTFLTFVCRILTSEKLTTLRVFCEYANALDGYMNNNIIENNIVLH